MGTVVLVPGRASAADPPVYPGAAKCYPTHCYMRAQDNHSGLQAMEMTMQSTWFSVLDQTRPGYERPAVDTSCVGGNCEWFQNHEMWLQQADGKRWVEVGLKNSYQPREESFADGRPGCGCQAYYMFWEDGGSGADVHATTHLIANVTPDDSWHRYRLARRGKTTTYDVFVDDRLVGTSTTTGMSSASASSIGAETSTYSTMQPLAYMNRSCQTNWWVQDNAGTWFRVTDPNRGVVGATAGASVLGHLVGGSKPSQTYFGGWDAKTHELCIGKGGL